MERLTLIGLYNYDDSLFNITLPTGIDKDMTVDAILHRGGQFEVIYPGYDFLKASITSWFNRHYRTFDKWIAALNIEYDPLNNYDRYEESSDNRTVSGNESGSVKDNSSSATNGITNGTTTGNQNNTVTNNVSAFDSANYQPKDQQISSETDSSSTSGITNTNINTNNTSEDERQHNTLDQNKHTAHLYGNIGVTTSQQMLQSELDIARFNIYDQIAELFIDDFCILVY